MRTLQQKLEVTANILIIVVTVLLGTVLIQKYLLRKPTESVRVQPVTGSKINLSDVNWANQRKTLILALQTQCHFCNESAPFYKRLVQAIQGKNVKLLAVFPTGIEESTAHLKDLGLTGFEVKRSTLESLQASGTPTLILTDDKGEVTNFWVGKLPPEKEEEVINKLKGD